MARGTRAFTYARVQCVHAVLRLSHAHTRAVHSLCLKHTHSLCIAANEQGCAASAPLHTSSRFGHLLWCCPSELLLDRHCCQVIQVKSSLAVKQIPKHHHHQVAKRVGVTNFPTKLERARGYPRRLNITRVRDDTRHRICHLAAIDYCCFNLPLPPVCGDNDSANVFCAAVQRGEQVRVTAWDSFPPKWHPDFHKQV